MVSPLSVEGLIPKTEKRRKSDEIKKRKKEKVKEEKAKKGEIDISINTEDSENEDEECDWTYEGSPSIELPDLPDLIL